MLESLGVKEVKQFRKRSSTVRRDSLVTTGNQMKIVLLDKIRKSAFFGILTDEVTEILNIQNLVTFINDHEKGEVHIAFIDSTNFLNFLKTNSTDSQTIHGCLLNLISSLKLELPNLKTFSSASVMTSKGGVVEKLREHKNLKHSLNVHGICHRLALACVDLCNYGHFLRTRQRALMFIKRVKRQSIRDGLVCIQLLMEYMRNMSVYWRHSVCQRLKEGQVAL